MSQISTGQLPLFQPPSLAVGELTIYLRQLLESDPNLQNIWVRGEVSNFSRPSSGHLYFTLKDSSASMRCVMWRNAAARQRYLPSDGAAIEVHGSIGIYDAGGQYQLYIDLIRPLGEGVLYQEFMRLKARLEAEGLFDPQRKRPITTWPPARRIGIITSPTGAALRDMLNTLRRRYPLVEVILAPTAVQGDEAPSGVIAALQHFNRLDAKQRPDVILVARGGGSIEDLWAFNDEGVARAIAASTIPVITGVGHETDFTIADFVADLRAPTPTAAAELATPDREELLAGLAGLADRLTRATANTLADERWRLEHLINRIHLRSPHSRLLSERQRIDELENRLGSAAGHSLQIQRMRATALLQRLAALNPLAVLDRGFSLVTLRNGQIIQYVRQVSEGQTIQVRVSDGQFAAQVTPPGAGEAPAGANP